MGLKRVRAVVTAQCDVEKLRVLAEFTETRADVGLKVIPSKSRQMFRKVLS